MPFICSKPLRMLFPPAGLPVRRGCALVLLLLAAGIGRAGVSQPLSDGWLGKTLQDLLYVDSPSMQGHDDSTGQARFSRADNPYAIYAGRTIAAVTVLNADDYRTDQDTPPRYEQWLHRPIDETRVQNYLMFKQGDPLNLFTLSDSERLLRASAYVDDARIMVQPAGDDAVEVLVVVRSTMPLLVEPRIHKLKSVGLVFSNKHLSPEGLDISAGTYLQRGYKQNMGYSADVGFENFKHTFISPRVYYSDRKNLVHYGVSVSRPFATPEMKYAGHVKVDRALSTITAYYKGLLLVQNDEKPFVLHYHTYDVWLARAVQLPSFRQTSRFRQTLTFGLRNDALCYERRKTGWSDRFYALQDQHSVLFSVHYAQQAYSTASHIYNFGRTEDIPEGWSAELTMGRSFDEEMTRFYHGVSFSGGRFMHSGGYGYFYAGFGCFSDKARMTQATMTASASHFTRLYPLGRGDGRSFLTASYKRALKPVTDDYLTLNNAGLIGIRSDSIRGQQRLVLQGESDFFTPWTVAGASMVLFAFCDVGWITSSAQRPVAGTTFASCGIGLRMRNERLVFSTLQLRMAFLINRPEYVTFDQLSISDDQRYKIQGFEPRAPERILINR